MKFCNLRKLYYFIFVAVLLSFTTMITACGGGGDYNGSVDKNPPLYSWWDGYDQSANTNVDNVTLNSWIANGFKTDKGEPVVIVDINSIFGTDKTIPGSFKGADVGYANNFVRDEGPLKTSEAANTTASQMVLPGATVDGILSKTGATPETVIVFADKNGISTGLTRVWWTFYYWGFSETKIKILDGRVANVAAAAVGQNWGSIQSGAFSVKQLPKLHSDARLSITQVIEALNNDSAIIWDSWGSHTVSNGGAKINKNRFFWSQGSLYSNGVLKDADTILDDILTAMIDPTNGLNRTDGIGTALGDLTGDEAKAVALDLLKKYRIIEHCQAGNAAAPAYYVAKEILPAVIGHDNAAMFDGSWSAWVVHTNRSPLGAYYANGIFENFDTTDYTVFTEPEGTFLGYAAKFWCRTAPVSGVCNDPVTVDANYSGDGRDLYHTDKEYLETRKSGSSGGHEGLGGGGGSGC